MAKIKAEIQNIFAGMNCAGEDKGGDCRVSSPEREEMAKIKTVMAVYLRQKE